MYLSGYINSELEIKKFCSGFGLDHDLRMLVKTASCLGEPLQRMKRVIDLEKLAAKVGLILFCKAHSQLELCKNATLNNFYAL